MERSADAFRTISEVAEDLDLPQHVLRFWETRFSQIKPLKRGGGRRYYRPDDVELLRAIRHLLYGEGYTIRGVQRILKEQGVKAVIALVRNAPARDAQSAAVAAPTASRDEPPMSNEQPGDASALSNADLGLLHAALAEIAECSRILQAARA
jgi:DNA-binding transcriptional MerR regulator